MKNWKTNLAAVITALAGVAVSLKWISPEVSVAILTIAATFGFAYAKDNNVTGGTTKQ